MRVHSRRAFSQLPQFLPFVAEKVATLPPWMEWYRPAIAGMQGAVESIHASLGGPWWLSISLLTIGIRLSMVPLVLLQMKAISPFAKAMPEFRLLKEVSDGAKMGSVEKSRLFIAGGRQIANQSEASLTKLISYSLLQVPLFLTFVWSVRSLCAVNEGLKVGGALWFQDLTVLDPYYVLPLISNALTYYTLGRGVTPENRDWLINRFRSVWQTFLIVTLPISCQWPAGVFCYWGTSALFTLIQMAILRHPKVQMRVNKNMIEEMKLTFSTNRTNEDADKIVHEITTGFSKPEFRSEAAVLAQMQSYLDAQNRIAREKQEKNDKK